MRSLYKVVSLLFVLGVVFCCQTVEKPEKPPVFLEEEEMFTLLYDMAIVKSGRDFDMQVLIKKGMVPSEYIYKKNNVDSATFKLNNAWYAANPRLYRKLFERVRDSLKSEKLRIERFVNIRDSIKSIRDSITFHTDTSKTSAPKGIVPPDQKNDKAEYYEN